MKERLTGAIILVVLIVLLVPELLTGPIGTKSAPAASAAAAASTAVPRAHAAHAQPTLRTYTLTLDPAPAPREVLAAQPAAAQPPSQGEPAPQAQPHPRARPAPALQVAKPPAHPPVREAGPPAASGRAGPSGWVVQLGSFADRENAVRLAHSLGARGFHMSISPARARSRVLWRVRAGPERDRAGAQRLAARLRALGHRGELLRVR